MSQETWRDTFKMVKASLEKEWIGGSEVQGGGVRGLTVKKLDGVLRVGRSSACELCRQSEFPVIRISEASRITRRALYD